MKYKTDKNDRPVYLQLYRQLKEDIINGVYPYKSKLPSKRLLAAEAGVSTVTVEHAYELLCDEGYAVPHERSGYFVIFCGGDGFVSDIACDKTPLRIPHSHSTSPIFPFSVFARTMRSVISDYCEELLEKSENKGRFELRSALRRYLLKNRGIDVHEEQIVVGSGSEYLYGLIIELLGKNKIYGIESPSYKKIEQVYRAYEVRYETLPLSNDGIDSSRLNSTNANVLHTTPYRSFPSGVTATASKRQEYIKWASVDGRYIIEDDYESEFSVSTKPVDTLFALSENENVIYLNTFSQTISSSLRIGYMVLPKELKKTFDEKLGFYSCTVPTFEQLVIARLLENGDFERHINRVRRHKRKEYEKQHDELSPC